MKALWSCVAKTIRDLVTYRKSNLNSFLASGDLSFQKSFWSTRIRVSNCLEPDQDRRYVGPDLAPNSLQRLSTNREQNLSLAWKQLKAFLLWHDGLIQSLYIMRRSRQGIRGSLEPRMNIFRNPVFWWQEWGFIRHGIMGNVKPIEQHL